MAGKIISLAGMDFDGDNSPDKETWQRMTKDMLKGLDLMIKELEKNKEEEA